MYQSFKNVSKELNHLGQPISDSMLITKIFMTLPENYKNFYFARDTIQNKSKTSYLSSQLIVGEKRQT